MAEEVRKSSWRDRRTNEMEQQHRDRLARVEARQAGAIAEGEAEREKQRRRAERAALVRANQQRLVADVSAALMAYLRAEVARPGSALGNLVSAVYGPGDDVPSAHTVPYPNALIVQTGGTWRPSQPGRQGDQVELVLVARAVNPATLKRLWVPAKPSEDAALAAALRAAIAFTWDAGRSRQLDAQNCARIVEDVSGRSDPAGGRPKIVASGYFERTDLVTLEARERAEVPPSLKPPKPQAVTQWRGQGDAGWIDPATTKIRR